MMKWLETSTGLEASRLLLSYGKMVSTLLTLQLKIMKSYCGFNISVFALTRHVSMRMVAFSSNHL